MFITALIDDCTKKREIACKQTHVATEMRTYTGDISFAPLNWTELSLSIRDVSKNANAQIAFFFFKQICQLGEP